LSTKCDINNIQGDTAEKSPWVIMFKTKRRIILFVIAILICAAAAMCYFLPSLIAAKSIDAGVTVWYVESNEVWEQLDGYIKEFNSGTGRQSGVSVSTCAFEDEQAMYDAVQLAADGEMALPSMIICESEYADYLYENGLSRDINACFGSSLIGRTAYTLAQQVKKGEAYSAMPIAAEAQLMIISRQLGFVPQTLEELCSAADEYYAKEGESFFTVGCFAELFANCLASLGEQFDALSPYDTESENSRELYNMLAETAYNRSFVLCEGSAAEAVAEGRLMCAITGASDIALNAGNADYEDFGIYPAPLPEKGEKTYSLRVYAVCVCTEDEADLSASEQFIKWFTSDEVNGRFTGGTGLIPAAKGVVLTADGETANAVREVLTAMQKEYSCFTEAAPENYALNAAGYEKLIITLMESLK